MKKLITIGSIIVASLLLVGCGSDSTSPVDSSKGTQNNRDSTTSSKTTMTKAYFGDKENNLIVVVDVENMKVIENIATGHEKSYAAEIIKTRANHESENPKMYVDNRGSNIIDVI
ncbi:MAG: hypothetical protein DSZ07_02365, partial [Sulfurovum sp.]